MPLAAIIATQLTDHSAHPWTLTIGGLDVIRQPGVSGNALGVPLSSIEVTEAGPGGVSSMTFDLEDPLGVWSLPVDFRGRPLKQEVILWDNTQDVPLFRGYLSGLDPTPHENGTGRWIGVDCDGIEIELDWNSTTLTYLSAAAMQCSDLWTQMIGATPLSTRIALAGNGTRATPIAAEVNASCVFDQTITRATLREAIRNLAVGQYDAYGQQNISADVQNAGLSVTVGFYRELRIWRYGPVNAPDDYDVLTVGIAGPKRAEDLTYSLEPGDVVRAVGVIGASSTDYGVFYDGSGYTGKTAIINDDTVTSAARARAAASVYMGQNAVGVRGSFRLTSYAPGSANVRAGSLVNITDGAVQLTSSVFTILSIVKRFAGGGTLQDWTVNFGGHVPSSMRELRRLTRGTRS